MGYTRKQLLLDEIEFKKLKKVYCGGIYSHASDSLFLREVISECLQKEARK